MEIDFFIACFLYLSIVLLLLYLAKRGSDCIVRKFSIHLFKNSEHFIRDMILMSLSVLGLLFLLVLALIIVSSII